MTNDELLHKWVNNTITETELEVFKLRPEYDSLVRLYEKTEILEGLDFDKQAMLSKIFTAPKNSPSSHNYELEKTALSRKEKFSILHWLSAGIAVCFLFISGYYFGQSLKSNNEVSYEIASNQRVEGVLPDQSTFVLRDDSKLSYHNENWEKHRIIKLNGTADFSVEKGSTFTVNTINGVVQVLGTQFTVESREDVIKVYCKEGKVSVTTFATDTKTILTAQEHVEAHKSGRLLISKKDVSSFRNVPLIEVLNSLKKQYNITVNSDGIDLTELLSCNYQHKELDLALKTTLTPLAIKYEVISDNTVRLFK